ncbi:hypothetical protein C8J55DRAFT_562772 [Lentinula edodes]|uniref:Uncharacterized protein n=1 Tax=Lentinula lateritia TaxID=40482 RepID=A0A9W9A4E5_9AGAR|nr:hypothetical protein C8J55DRAFT_562772 [Lentinula edodes]
MLDDTDTPNDTSNIEKLALSIKSGVPQLEPSSLLICCCQQDECSNLKAWRAFVSRLEHDLILSAEVGQALLQRHDALRLLHQGRSENSEDHHHAQLSELLEKNHTLEKKLDLAFINNEAAEASASTLHRELDEARATINRLSANHANNITLGAHLSRLNGELDDMQQERDVALARVTVTELKLKGSMKKASELQSEVYRLQKELKLKDQLCVDSKESLLQGAKSKIQMLALNAASGSTGTSTSENLELTKALENLYSHNEKLKRHNDELQTLLANAQDEIYNLREEVEHRANPPMQRLLECNEDYKTRDVSSSSLEMDANIFNRSTLDLRAPHGEEWQAEPPMQHLSEIDQDVSHIHIERESHFVERSEVHANHLEGQITVDPKSKANASLIGSIDTTTFIRDKFLESLFLIGILSYWLYCMKFLWLLSAKYGSRPGLVGFLLPAVLSFILVQNLERHDITVQPKPILVTVTTFIGTLSCTFIGWWIISMVGEANKVSSQHIIKTYFAVHCVCFEFRGLVVKAPYSVTSQSIIAFDNDSQASLAVATADATSNSSAPASIKPSAFSHRHIFIDTTNHLCALIHGFRSTVGGERGSNRSNQSTR